MLRNETSRNIAILKKQINEDYSRLYWRTVPQSTIEDDTIVWKGAIQILFWGNILRKRIP